jgi:uncharacterized protein (TIGR02246 family)
MEAAVVRRRHLWSGGTKYHNKCKWSTDMDAASEIRQLIDRYVTAGGKGDLQGVLDTLTDDVVFLPPNDTPKVGKEELRRWLQPFQEHYTSKDIAQSRELRVAGDIAYEWGLFQETFTPKDPASGNKPISLDGKFLRVYHRQPDGSWRLARACWNSNLPADS